MSSVNAVIYARYSSDRQTEQSIEGQLRYCYNYAKQNDYNIVGEYIDRALTGTNDHRPNFQRMITDSAKKQFQYIIVWKLDRFARNRYDSVFFKNKLKKSGVRVLSVTEVIGTGDESVMLEAVLEAMAEIYSSQLSQNVKRGLRESAIKGYATGGNIPLGYKLIDRHLVLDDYSVPVVKYIFEEYAKGKTKKQISEGLNEKGFRTAEGNLFTVKNFTHILQNKIYIGDHNFRGEIERSCPQIIEKDIFDKCQIRTEQGRHIRGRKLSDVEFYLTGKIFCGHCKAPMSGDSGTSRNGDRYYYYNCNNRKKHSSCKKKLEKKDFIEWYIVEQTLEYILTPNRIELIAERVVAQYDNEYNNQNIKLLEKQLAKIESELNRCFELIMKAESDSVIKKINARSVELDQQKKDIEIDLAKMRIANKARITVKEIVEWIKSFCTGDIMDEEFRRRIIDVFINSVYLYDDKILIYYNIKGGEQTSFFEPPDDIDDISHDGDLCSDSSRQCLPCTPQSEHIIILNVREGFGIKIIRE